MSAFNIMAICYDINPPKSCRIIVNRGDKVYMLKDKIKQKMREISTCGQIKLKLGKKELNDDAATVISCGILGSSVLTIELNNCTDNRLEVQGHRIPNPRLDSQHKRDLDKKRQLPGPAQKTMHGHTQKPQEKLTAVEVHKPELTHKLQGEGATPKKGKEATSDVENSEQSELIKNAFRKDFCNIIEAIGDPDNITYRLYQEEIISRDVKEDIISSKTLPIKKRAGKLVDAVEKSICVSRNPLIILKKFALAASAEGNHDLKSVILHMEPSIRISIDHLLSDKSTSKIRPDSGSCKKCKITNPNLVSKKLYHTASNWYSLGALLNIQVEDLDKILDKHHNCGDRFVDMINTWVKTDPLPTWQKILSAVDTVDVYKKFKTHIISREFCCTCCFH